MLKCTSKHNLGTVSARVKVTEWNRTELRPQGPGAQGGGPGRGPGPRDPREGSLRSYIERVLRASGKPMRVAEITQAVRKAGYATSNKTLDKTVGITLAGMSNVRKVKRGVYRTK
jgi:hypothetical protein